MKTLIRRHPIDIYLLTGEEAREAREVAFGGHAEELVGRGPCFVTNSFGHDGFAWDTPEQFEDDWGTTFGTLAPSPNLCGPLRLCVSLVPHHCTPIPLKDLM